MPWLPASFLASVTFNILKRLQSLCFCCQVIPDVRFELTIWNIWSSRISLYASPAQNKLCRIWTHTNGFGDHRTTNYANNLKSTILPLDEWPILPMMESNHRQVLQRHQYYHYTNGHQYCQWRNRTFVMGFKVPCPTIERIGIKFILCYTYMGN